MRRDCSTCGWSPDDDHGPEGPCEGCTPRDRLGWENPHPVIDVYPDHCPRCNYSDWHDPAVCAECLPSEWDTTTPEQLGGLAADFMVASIALVVLGVAEHYLAKHRGD